MRAFARGRAAFAAFAAAAAVATLPSACPTAHGAEPARWLRPSRPDAPLVWGRADGIVFGLPSPGGMPGPRGLVRVGILREGQERPDLVNFLAFEPVVGGKKGLSELERSGLDGVPGKRLTVLGPAGGRLAGAETVPGGAPGGGASRGPEELLVEVACEPFENGARVRAELRVRADRPEELRVALFDVEGSAPIEECTVTATMGNYGRLRRLALGGRWVDSRELYRGYEGDGFVERPPYPLAEVLRLPGGDAAAALVSDEPDPASVPIDRPPWWQYRSVPLTHYWVVPARDVRPELRVRVNGRRVYWRSAREVPGGIAFENFEVRQGFAPGQAFVFGLSRKSPAELGLAPRAKVPVIYATDLYHPHEDADDHFDLASLFALEEIDVRAVILDQAAHSQEERPGRVALEQVFKLAGRRAPYAAGLRKRLSTPEDKGLEDERRNQAGVELLLESLRESPAPVAIVAVGSLRDVAAAFNREPALFRERAGRLLVFAGDATEEHSNREYNVGLDPCAFACVLGSGLDVGWVPCFDGGPPENRGRASRWVAERRAALEGCSDAVLNYFLYALRKLDLDPAAFLERPVTPEDRAWLLSGTKELFCTAIFASLSGRRTCFDGKRWVALPLERASGLEERPVFGFAPVEVAVSDDGRVRYGPGPGSKRLRRFEVLDKERYAEAMTSMTAALLEGLGRPAAPR